MIELSNAEKLSRAVLLFFRNGAWTEADNEMWHLLTDCSDVTTKTLCKLARIVRKEEEKERVPEGMKPVPFEVG